MTPTTELPDEIHAYVDPDDYIQRWYRLVNNGVPDEGDAAYTRKDKADAEIERLRAAVRDLAESIEYVGSEDRNIYMNQSTEEHADTIKECMKDE